MADVLGASFLASPGWEIQRTHNFELTIAGVGDSERLLTLSVVNCTLPNDSNEAITVNYGNSSVKVAGAYAVGGSGTLTVNDFIEKDMEALIESWRSTVYNKATDAVGFASDYKKQGRITLYAPDGTIERTWIIEGLWPSAVDYGTLDYTSPGLKQIAITFEYDKAIISRG